MSETAFTTGPYVAPSDRLSYFFSRYWLGAFILLYGLFAWTPFLAPVFQWAGWTGAGQLVYGIYSFLCHQLPERSFFLFGPKISYSLAEVQVAWKMTDNPFILRQFIGTPQMGWKVAWSDRMVSMYGGVWIFAVLWKPLIRRWGKLPWWGFGAFAFPMAVDGGTHFISDLAGIGHGFRDSNQWLAALTRNFFGPNFYAGDAVGSFNSWMRLITGLLFALGLVWWAFPYIDESFAYTRRYLDSKFTQMRRDYLVLHPEAEVSK